MYLIMFNRNCFGHIFQRWRFFSCAKFDIFVILVANKIWSIAKLMHVLVRNECISFRFHPGKASCPIHMGLFHPVKTRSYFFQGTSSRMNRFKFNEKVRSCQSRPARYNRPTHLHISNPYTTSRSKNCKY